MTTTITMTSKGQFTLPATVRRALALQRPGDKLVLDFRSDSQEVILSKPVSVEGIRAKAKSYIKPGTTPLTDVDTFYNAREPRL